LLGTLAYIVALGCRGGWSSITCRRTDGITIGQGICTTSTSCRKSNG
jgi:hypothetical protein